MSPLFYIIGRRPPGVSGKYELFFLTPPAAGPRSYHRVVEIFEQHYFFSVHVCSS